MATSAADATASFAMDLGVEGADESLSAAAALEKFDKAITQGTESLASMQKALRLLKGDSVGNAAQIKDLSDKIKGQRATVAANTAEFLKLGGSFKKAKPDALALIEAIKGASGPMSDLLGGATSAYKGLSKISDILGGGAMAAGLIGVSLAIVAVTAAAIAGVAALVKFGLAAADARRTEELHLEGLAKTRVGFWNFGQAAGLAADKASFLQETIDKVSSRVSIGRSEVVGYTEQLYKMGLRGENLKAALEGATITASAQGDAAAQAFIGMAQGAQFAGQSIRSLANDAKARLGGIVARQMLSLGVQGKKLSENLNFLFAGVKIESFVAGLKTVTDLFSANTESGKALAQIIETLFNPFFSGAGSAAIIVKRFFQGMIIGAQDLLIALFPVRKWLHDTFKDSDVLGGITAQSTAVKLGTIAVYGLAGALAIGAVALGAFAAAALVCVSPFLLVGAAAYGAYQLVKDLLWGDLGTNIVKGIAGGIESGAKWVTDAITNLAKEARDKFKAVLGIHSPSVIFRAEALNVPRGAALGIDDGAPLVQSAVARMAPEPMFDAAPARASADASGRADAASVSIQIGELVLKTEARDPTAQARDFAEQLVRLLQGAAIQMGAPAAANVP